MKIHNMLFAAVAALGLSTGFAHADTIKGVYVNAEAGAVLSQTQHNSVAGSSSQVGHAPGFGGEAAVGYGFGNGLQVEIEGDYLQTHINRVSPQNAHGHDRNFGGFLNVIYSIDLKDHFGIDSPVTPYIGIGTGYMVSQYNVSSPVRGINGTQGSFAYQGIVGARFNTPVKNLYVNADYRMIGQTMSKDSFSSEDSHFDHRFNHTFNVGILYNFGADKPVVEQAAEIVPVPQPARSYLVFFDWDQYNLSSQAKRIVDGAAEASRSQHVTTINVNGYTDNTSIAGGKRGAEYNQKLSNVRAENVANELVAKGVDPKSIIVKGFGQEHPIVQTALNTREPQNRRVEIILH